MKNMGIQAQINDLKLLTHEQDLMIEKLKTIIYKMCYDHTLTDYENSIVGRVVLATKEPKDVIRD